MAKIDSIYLFGSLARRILGKQPEDKREFHLNDELGQLGQPNGIDVNILDLTNCLDARFLQNVFNSGEAISLYEPERS